MPIPIPSEGDGDDETSSTGPGPGPAPYGVTVVRVRPAAPGRHGDSSGDPAETDIPGCVVWPTDGNGSAGNETTDRRDTVVWGYTVLLPDPDTDARPTDRWRYAGALYEQAGEAARYQHPLTGDRVLTIAIRRTTG